MFRWILDHETAAFRRGIALCLALCVVLCGLSWYTRTRFSAMDARFTLARLSKTEAAARDGEGNEAVLTGSRELALDSGVQTLAYRGETVERFLDAQSGNISCRFADGEVVAEKELSDSDAPHHAEYRLLRRMVQLYEGRAPRTRLLLALPISLLVCLLGLLMLCFPERNWELTHFLTIADGKPTALALDVIQVCGLLVLAAGLIVALAG